MSILAGFWQPAKYLRHGFWQRPLIVPVDAPHISARPAAPDSLAQHRASAPLTCIGSLAHDLSPVPPVLPAVPPRGCLPTSLNRLHRSSLHRELFPNVDLKGWRLRHIDHRARDGDCLRCMPVGIESSHTILAGAPRLRCRQDRWLRRRGPQRQVVPRLPLPVDGRPGADGRVPGWQGHQGHARLL